jgi:hypothetical protein
LTLELTQRFRVGGANHLGASQLLRHQHGHASLLRTPGSAPPA